MTSLPHQRNWQADELSAYRVTDMMLARVSTSRALVASASSKVLISIEKVPTKVKGCACCNGKKKKAGYCQSPCWAGEFKAVAYMLLKGPALGLAKAITKHYQRNAGNDCLFGWHFKDQASCKEQESNKSHSGVPFVSYDIGESFDSLAEKLFHSLFLSSTERVVQRVSAGTLARTSYRGNKDNLSTCGVFSS